MNRLPLHGARTAAQPPQRFHSRWAPAPADAAQPVDQEERVTIYPVETLGPDDSSPPYDEMLDRRVLVCGDRNWTDEWVIHDIVLGLLERQVQNFGRLFLVEGCARGADRAACQMWDGRPADGGGVRGEHNALVHEHFPADWDQHGKAAGPIRNRQMLAQRPEAVFAFHDDIENSKGTKDMVTIAKKAGIPTYVVRHA